MKMKGSNVRKKHEQKLRIKASPPLPIVLRIKSIQEQDIKYQFGEEWFCNILGGNLEYRETCILDPMKKKIVKACAKLSMLMVRLGLVNNP